MFKPFKARKIARHCLAAVALLCLWDNGKAQRQDSTSFKIGLKSWIFYPADNKHVGPVRLAGEFQYLYKNTRWAIGYQYYALQERARNLTQIRGTYLESEFLYEHLRERLRLGFPLRFYLVHDHYIENDDPFSNSEALTLGLLSIGANLRYRLGHNWEVGLEAGYVGMGFNALNYDGFTYGMIDGTGVSLYYRF